MSTPRPSRAGRWIWCLAGAAVLAGAWWAWSSRAQSTSPADPPAARSEPAVPVVTAAATRTPDVLDVQAVGTALALRSATLQPAVAGEVAAVLFRPGQAVRAGQRLLQLQDRKERLAVDLAAAQVDSTRRLVDRLARTDGTGAVPGSVVDDARHALRQAEIGLSQAREALADRVLSAPFAGVVGLSQVDPGDRVTPDTVITTLDDRRRLRVAFDLPEPYLARLQPAQAVRLTSVAFPGQVFEGRITQTDNRVASDTRTLRVRAEVDNADDRLRPGMSFEVALALPGEARTQVPDLALQWGRDGGHVWVVRDGRARQVPVRLVRRLEGAVLLDGDLRDDEAVVVEGVQRLRPGRPVTVLEPAS